MTVEENNKLPLTLSAEEAHEMSQKGELLLIDVRTPMEWMRSGVAEGALTITPQSPAFMEELDEAMGHDKAKPIGLICATGNRTAMIQRHLQQAGYSSVVDVSEGMMGNFSAAGWLRKNLPTVTYRG
jgi:rhodanese-related sulfurtransferase